MAIPFRFGAHRGWSHDEGHAGGAFHTFDALDLGFLGPRKVHVWVPRRPPPATGFRTIYVHDGNTAFWRGGVAHQTWDLASVLSRDGVEPRLVVALHPLRRDWEYTHVDWAPGRPHGGLAQYADWLAGRVKPWIDAHYPTDPRREATAVLGSSHGGLASFWTATRHPDDFGDAGCFSSSFFSGLDDLVTGWHSGIDLATAPLVRDVAPLLADPSRRPRLWLDWGLRRDGGEHNSIVEHLATLRGRELGELLQRRFGYVEGVDLHTVEHAEGGHDEASWGRRFGWWLDRTRGPA
jgi:hypothetical protein